MREGRTVAQVTAELRTHGRLPPQTDAVYVVDARNVFKGALTLEALLVSPPDRSASQALRNELVVLSAHDDAGAAAKAFERYDLVAAPVVDERGKLLGRLTVDAILRRDYPIIQAVILLSSGVYVMVNLVIDLVYTVLDPRIRY